MARITRRRLRKPRYGGTICKGQDYSMFVDEVYGISSLETSGEVAGERFGLDC